MASLSSNINVWNSCLWVLEQQGWTLRIDVGPYEDDEASHSYHAKLGEFTLQADNPIELLGLAGIYSHLKPTEAASYWWSCAQDDVSDRLIDEGLRESFWELWERDPALWRKLARRGLEDEDPADSLGVPPSDLELILRRLGEIGT